MRIKLDLVQANKSGFNIPINYNHFLTSVVYKTIGDSSNEYASFLHDEGYSSKEVGKKFKLFTYSQLRFSNMEVQGDMINSKTPEVWCYISSPVTQFIEHLASGLLDSGDVRIGKETFHVMKISSVKPPVFTDEMDFLCMSPIVSSTMVQKKGELKTYYYRFDDEELSTALLSNLKNKYKLIHGEESKSVDERFNVTFDKDYVEKKNGRISKLVDFKDVRIKGIFAPFTVTGNPELIRLGYQAGFGEKGSMGFGMVKEIN